MESNQIKTPWQDKYFKKELKDILNKKTGKTESVMHSVCTVEISTSQTQTKPCGKAYIFNPKYGTGNFIRHLANAHKIDDKSGNRANFPNEVQFRVSVYFYNLPIRCLLLHSFLKKELNAENLKDALAKLIIAQNLPFTHVESETFLELIKLLNPDAERLMVKADAIRDYIMRKSLQIRDTVKKELASEEVIAVNCTCDVWTSPNNDPIFALTGHWTGTKGTLQIRGSMRSFPVYLIR